jgi:hypothetical protein
MAFLSFLHNSSPSRVRVRTFDSAGLTLQNSTFSVPYDVTASINTVAAGPAQILAQFGGVGITTFSGVAYYTVELEDTGLGLRSLQTRRFDLTESCTDALRLHWFNLLGGGDAYTFRTVRTRKIQADAEQGTRPLAWSGGANPHNINSLGAFRVSSDAVQVYDAETGALEPGAADWLAEMLLSNRVFRETAAGLVPVVVRSTQADVARGGSRVLNLGEVKIEIEDANGIIIQSN